MTSSTLISKINWKKEWLYLQRLGKMFTAGKKAWISLRDGNKSLGKELDKKDRSAGSRFGSSIHFKRGLCFTVSQNRPQYYRGHISSSISLCISVHMGVIWAGFLSRFRVDDCVSFGLCCGVDCTVLQKQKSWCFGLLGQVEKTECVPWLHERRLRRLNWVVLMFFSNSNEGLKLKILFALFQGERHVFLEVHSYSLEYFLCTNSLRFSQNFP